MTVVTDLLADLITYGEQGGIVMPPLMLATLVLWFAIGTRHANLKRGRPHSVRRMIDKVRDGTFAPGSDRGIIDAAVMEGLDEVGKRHDRLRPYLDSCLAPMENRMRRLSRLITAIVTVAPLMGLLGTVIGMIETFESLGDMTLHSQSGGIAGGISQALFTTQMGLAVAIPGLLAKGWLDRREAKLEMELALLKDILCGDAQAASAQALGHRK